MDKTPKYISQERQEEFERLLLGQMERAEETEFNEKLERNPELHRQFDEFKALFLAVEEEGLRKVLDDFHDTLVEGVPAEKKYFTFYGIAAGVAILIALGLSLFNRQSPNDNVFEQYFSPDPGLPTVMGTHENYTFYEAMVDYKQGHYDEAIEKWEKLVAEKPGNDTLNYFLGVSHLANENIDKAIGYLNSPTLRKNSIFYDESHTYLGLALIKNGEISKAKTVLAKSGSAKSRRILSQLK